jgi:hypothetical protein
VDAIRKREVGLISLFGNCDALHTRAYARALCHPIRNETAAGGEYTELEPDTAENE